MTHKRITELEEGLREVQRMAIRAEIAKLNVIYDVLHSIDVHEEIALVSSAWLHRLIDHCDHLLNKNVEA